MTDIPTFNKHLLGTHHGPQVPSQNLGYKDELGTSPALSLLMGWREKQAWKAAVTEWRAGPPQAEGRGRTEEAQHLHPEEPERG